MRSGLVWLLAVLGASAVAGCTTASPDDPPPTITSTYQPHSHPATPTTPPPISTGANVRPGEKPPTLSPVGKTNTAAGALAFADYWMRTLDWGYATTDSTLAKSAFVDSCSNCAVLVKQFDDARAKGRHFRGGRSRVSSSSLQTNDHHNDATAVDDVTISTQPVRVLDSAGRVVDSAPANGTLTFRTWLKWRAIGWRVVDWKEVVAK
jgi:Family of unknown function (DUF6318)